MKTLLILLTLVMPILSYSSPRKTMKTFLRSMVEYKNGNQDALLNAVETLNLSKIDDSIKATTGVLIANQLIQTLDRLEKINYENIPNNQRGPTWVYKKESYYDQGDYKHVEISISKNLDKWHFSPATVESIGDYYNFVKNKSIVKDVQELKNYRAKIKKSMPAWTGKSYFLLKNGQWLAILCIFLIGRILALLFNFNLDQIILRLLARENITLSEEIKKKVYKSIKYLTLAGSWIVGIRLIELESTTLMPLLRIGYIVFTVSAVILTYYFCDLLGAYFLNKAHKTESKFDDILIPLLQNSAKFVVIIIGLVFIGQSLTLDMQGIIAGLGIGGLAFAFAAKDAISNIFGSITVLFDRPFHIGDWVVVNGNIEGTVEAVGLRSTKIRTFYNSLVSVPNGNMTNASIDNYNKREFRRYKTHLTIQYDTPVEKIEAFCEGVRELLISNEYVRQDYFNVYLNEMSDSSLNILLHMFWKVPSYEIELTQKHKLLIDIIRLADSLKVGFAFPTRTLHLFNEEKGEDDLIPNNELPQMYGKLKAQDIEKKSISAKKPRSNKQAAEKLDKDDF